MQISIRKSVTSAIASALLLAGGTLLSVTGFAGGLADLSNQDAAQAIKGALNSGVATAVNQLGKPGGFLDNPKVRIPLPPALQDVASAMKLVGHGKDADDLEASMNKAAEQAVPQARALLVEAVRSMTLIDAKNILSGGDDSVTQFFRSRTSNTLTEKFLPIVKRSTDRVGLAQKYNQFADQGAKIGLIKGDAVNIEQYVTAKALDGLYTMIGEEEHAIRQNPAAAGSAIVSKVFSALR